MKTLFFATVLALFAPVLIFGQSNCANPFVTIAPDPSVPFSDCCIFIDMDNSISNTITFLKLENPNGFNFNNVQAFNGWTVSNVTNTSAEIHFNTTYLANGFFADYIRFCMTDITAFPQTLDISYYEEDMNGSPVLYCAQTRSMDCPLTPTCDVYGCFTATSNGLSVDFDSGCSYGNGTLSYLWNFGDGNTSTDPDPVHFYSNNNNNVYQTCLTVTNQFNGMSCDTTLCQILNLSCSLSSELDEAITICNGSTIQMSPIITGSTGMLNYNWSPAISLDNNTIQNPTSNTLMTTLYTLEVTDGSGCTFIDSILVEVSNPSLHLVDSIALCAWEDTIINATFNGGIGISTYNWTPGTGLSDSTILNPIVSANDQTYQLQVTDEIGCTAEESLVVSVEECCTIVVAIKDTITICEGDNQILHLGVSGEMGNVSYSWSPASSLNDSTLANPTASPNITTVYTLTATDAQGCMDSEQLVVIVEDCCLIEVSLPDTLQICQNDSIQVLASVSNTQGPVAYSWTPANITSDPLSPDPFLFPMTSSSFIVTVEDNTRCVDSDTVFVEVQLCCDNIEVTATGQTNICWGESTQLGALVSGANGNSTYLWTSSEPLSDSTIQHPIASPLNSADYYLQVTDSLGCTAFDTLSIIVTDCCDLSMDYFSQHNICENGIATLGGSVQTSNGPVTYLWQPSTGLSDSTAANPQASLANTVTYTLTVTDSLGCTDAVQISVKVEDCPCDNLIIDGDFENPNMAVTNNLTDACVCMIESYCITDQAQNKCSVSQWQNILAPGGSGNYMVIDADIWDVIWESPVSIAANENYFFCFDYYPDISSGGLPMLTIELYDGANLVAALGSTSGISNTWSNYCTPMWLANNPGNYTLRIRQINSPVFSDYGIDNLHFSCGEASAVVENSFRNEDFSLFPNPFSNELHILAENRLIQHSTYSIVDVNGIEWKSGTINMGDEKSSLLGLGSLPSGIYFIRLGNPKSGFGWKKLIKQ